MTFSLVSAGGSEKVECASAVGLPTSVGASLTVAYWQKTSAYVSLSQVFGFGTQLPLVSVLGENRYTLQFSNDYYWWGESDDVDSGIAWDSDSSWHHVAWTYNGTTLILYRDGVNVFNGPWSSSAVAGTYVTAFSHHAAGTTSPNTKLADPAIWSTVLSPSQIASLAAGTRRPSDFSVNLQQYWRLAEGSGATAADSSGNSNTGILTGGVTWSSDIPAFKTASNALFSFGGP